MGVSKEFDLSSLGGVLPIERDRARFKEIVRGKVRENLRKYISNGELIGRKGKDLVRIPMPELIPPHFRFGEGQGGVGQGEGNEGDPIGRGGQKGTNPGQGGDQEGDHGLEVEFTIDELVEEIWRMIHLPNLLPLPGEIVEYYWRMRGITTNPTVIMDKKKSYKNALAKIADDPHEAVKYMGVKGIRKNRNFERLPRPSVNATVIYMMDISGSIDDKKRAIIRQAMFWIQLLLDKAYEGKVNDIYIAHDAVAWRVKTQEEALALRSGGGTKVSTALEMCLKYAKENSDSNIFPIYFGDGENWGKEDDARCAAILKEMLTELFWVRMFGYTQVRPSSYSKTLVDALRGSASGIDTSRGTGRYVDHTINELDEVLDLILGLFGAEAKG